MPQSTGELWPWEEHLNFRDREGWNAEENRWESGWAAWGRASDREAHEAWLKWSYSPQGQAATAEHGQAGTPRGLDPIWPWMQEPFGDWLFSGFQQREDGGWELKPATTYPGQLNPDAANTRLPEVWNSWQPWDAGTQDLAQYLATGKGPSPMATEGYQNMREYGGIGGYPTELMHNIAQFGGTGGPGNLGMSNMLQFGIPSEAGRPVTTMERTGTSSPTGAGAMLLARAQGLPTPASQVLNPFLAQGAPYQAPNIQPRRLTRRV